MFCCGRCQEADKCVRKWVFGQKGIDQTCCPQCQYFYDCLAKNRQKRWQLVHDFINGGDYGKRDS